ncbi:MAG TPA: hypothetical protein VI756_11345 [Blastocatellia bacterium]
MIRILDGAFHSKMGKRRTSADIVFEYASNSNANYDRTTKVDTYLALGVKELVAFAKDDEGGPNQYQFYLKRLRQRTR